MPSKRNPPSRGNKRGQKNQITLYLTNDNLKHANSRASEFGNSRNAYLEWLVSQDKARLKLELLKATSGG